MMQIARQAEKHLRAVYHPDGLNIGMNIGRAAGAGISGPYPHARAAALDGRRQFHDHGGETRIIPEDISHVRKIVGAVNAMRQPDKDRSCLS